MSAPEGVSTPAGSGRRSLAAGRRFRLLRVYRTALAVLVSYGLFALLKSVRGEPWAERALPGWNRINARRVMRTVLEVRGLFIKVGQLVGTLSSFLPAEFRAELEGLQDRIPPRPWNEARRRLAEELEVEPEAAFAEIEHQPVAAASLAQVHAARLHDGRRVAVKVQHVGIERLAELDLATARRILGLVALATGARGLDGVFEQMRTILLEELDFGREADHIERIGGHFEDDPRVAVPPVVRELSTHRVLVTGFVDGIKITDLEALAARGVDRVALAERLLRAYCQMIFVDGDYHADPHPGNLLVGDDGTLFFVDFGAVGRLSPAMRAGVPQLVDGLLKRDRDQILRALATMGFVRAGESHGVAERVIEYVDSRLLAMLGEGGWELGEIHFDPKMKVEMIAELRRLDLLVSDLTATFEVPREWILLLRTLTLLLGVCTELDPAMRPMTVVSPYLEEFVLGRDRDWLALVRSWARELALTAVALPGDLRRLLRKAEAGRMVVEVRGLREGAALTYALGHQLLYGTFALGTGALAMAAASNGEAGLAQGLTWACGASLALLGGSLWRARRWQRKVRRGI